MAQPLDRRAAEKQEEDLKPGNPQVNALVRDLLVVLGEDWEQEDTTKGVVLSFRSIFSVLVLDVGCGLVGVNAMMPEEFMPQLGFQRPFSLGPEVIAKEITGSLLQMYLTIVDGAKEVQEDEKRWERRTKETIELWAHRMGAHPRIDVVRDPGLTISAFFTRENGGTIRVFLSPGSTPAVHIYTAAQDDVDAYLTLWDQLHPRKADPED